MNISHKMLAVLLSILTAAISMPYQAAAQTILGGASAFRGTSGATSGIPRVELTDGQPASPVPSVSLVPALNGSVSAPALVSPALSVSAVSIVAAPALAVPSGAGATPGTVNAAKIPTLDAKGQLAISGDKLAVAAAKGGGQSRVLDALFTSDDQSNDVALASPQGTNVANFEASGPKASAGKTVSARLKAWGRGGTMSAAMALSLPAVAMSQEASQRGGIAWELLAPILVMVTGVVLAHVAEFVSRRKSEPLPAKRAYKRQLLAVPGVTGVSFYDHVELYDPRGDEKHVYADFGDVAALMDARKRGLIPAQPSQLGGYKVITRLSSSGKRRAIRDYRKALLQVPGVADVRIHHLEPDFGPGRYGNFIDIRFLSATDMQSAMASNLIPARFPGLEDYTVDIALTGR